MRLTILSMISTSSLQAFSGASTTGSLQRPSAPSAAAASAARLVRDQASARNAGPAAAIPDTKPSLPPPRGSLLNLSV